MILGTRGFGAYTFFAIFCGLSAIWTYVAVPESKPLHMSFLPDISQQMVSLPNMKVYVLTMEQPRDEVWKTWIEYLEIMQQNKI